MSDSTSYNDRQFIYSVPLAACLIVQKHESLSYKIVCVQTLHTRIIDSKTSVTRTAMIYHALFELVFEFPGNSSDSSRK